MEYQVFHWAESFSVLSDRPWYLKDDGRPVTPDPCNQLLLKIIQCINIVDFDKSFMDHWTINGLYDKVHGSIS